jgi:hypothetical protein
MFDELGVALKYTHDGMGASKLRPFEKQNHCTRTAYQDEPVVFLSRDPRDTVVSGYFHAKHRVGNYQGEISQFIRDPLCGIEKIVQFNLTWIKRGANLPVFLPITYEQTTANTFDVMRNVAKFVGAELAEAEIRKVVADNTFDKMHKRESQDEYRQRYDWELSPGDPSEPESYKLRRGKIGGFLDYFSEEDVAYCNAVLNRYRYFEEVEKLVV